MIALKNRIGEKYGKLTVLSRADNKAGGAAWNCICECGNKTITSGNKLHSGTKSCGCLGGKFRNLVGIFF
jgi:hypothetical protein